MPHIFGRRRSENVQVSRTEDECVEHLSDERHTFERKQRPPRSETRCDKLTLCTAVRVDSPYQYELRRGMRDIAEDVEKVEPHVGGERSCATATQQ
jgi:hypothetical protein